MNEQNETIERPMEQPTKANDLRPTAPLPEARTTASIAPQSGDGTCACGGAASSTPNGTSTVSYVYAIGRVEARFPNLSAEKEFAQATGRTDTAGKTDQQTFHAVLSKRENRYLVRQLCWVLTIQGLETYLLLPRDPADIDLLVEAIRPAPTANDIDVVIGMRGPIAPPDDVQWADGAHRRIRPDLFVRPRRAHQSHPKAGGDYGRAVRPGGRGTVQQDHATDGQRRGDGRTSRLELSRHALSCHLCQGSRGVCAGFFADRGRSAAVALERHAQKSWMSSSPTPTATPISRRSSLCGWM